MDGTRGIGAHVKERGRQVMSIKRVAARGLVAAVATAALLCGALLPATATAAVAESTPVPIETPDGVTSSYVLNARATGSAAIARLSDVVTAAGGAVVQTWPEIGVVIAHAQTASFRADVAAEAGELLDSVGATRTVPVLEATPEPVKPQRARHDAWAPANGDIPAPATPSVTRDPGAGDQWDMDLIRADEAAAVSGGSPTVLVGVLDGGIDADHPDLAEQIDAAASVNCTAAGRPDTTPGAWASTTSDHGTHVAGTIAAARNGIGITGVAPSVRLASVKVVSDEGLIYPEYAVCGFMWAAQQGMDVTNNSYYVDPFLYYCQDQPDQAAALAAVRRAVAWSARLGVVNVAAAGNESTDLTTVSRDQISPNDSLPVSRSINDGCINIPGELNDVISVGSVDSASQLSIFSNTGLGAIDVVAPGSDILSTIDEGNGWGMMSGTSMASPHAAGVAALLKSTHPDWSAREVRDALIADAQPMSCPRASDDMLLPCTEADGKTSYYGAGLVDAFAAVTP